MIKKVYFWIFVCLYQLCLGQESFRFQVKIEPNTTYTTQVETSTNGFVDFVADESILEQMKTNGIESHMTMNQKMNMTLVSRTKNRNKNGETPASMT